MESSPDVVTMHDVQEIHTYYWLLSDEMKAGLSKYKQAIMGHALSGVTPVIQAGGAPDAKVSSSKRALALSYCM